MKTTTYWLNRTNLEKQRRKLLDNQILNTEKEIQGMYIKLSRKLISELESAYKEYLLEPTSNNIYGFRRYYEIVNQINDELTKLGIGEQRILSKHLINTYEYTNELVNNHIGFSNKITDVEDVINRVWCDDGINWSQRIWKHKDRLVETLRQGLVDCANAGKSVDELVKLLMHDFGVSYNQAKTLARTELSHIQVQSTVDSYKNAGVNEVEWYTAHDCCEECWELNGKKYYIDDMGELPPLHPNCRCTIMPVIE